MSLLIIRANKLKQTIKKIICEHENYDFEN